MHRSRLGTIVIDCQTQDIEAAAASWSQAEVTRLEQLGAKRVQFVRRWWVMESPTGQRFCVVRPQRADFPGDANTWDTPAPGS